MLEIVILTLYTICMICILIYCLAEVHLAVNYSRFKRKQEGKEESDNHLAPVAYAKVTIQLPIFNEQYVVERLIDAVVRFDYPKEQLQIQVLDDSTDETVAISQAKVAEYQAKGYDIVLLHRKDRTGYKAGALQAAMDSVKGEFIAIFDADFIPNSDFLLKTLPHFDNEKVGVVQTRWEHINKEYSLLTKVQAFFLDVHFTVEQLGRNVSGYFINFNGTAGVWRTKAITDAGGWKADTLTEDLDLSYRAQLRGWQFKYLEAVGSPSELPADMRAFKSQQFRWIKGGAETAKKILPSVVRSDYPFSIKFNAFSHLLSSSVYIIIFILCFLSVPLLLVKNQYIDFEYIHYGSIFFLSNIAVAYVYFVATKYRMEDKSKVWKKFAYLLPIFLVITMGLSLHNALAAIRGLWGEQTPFIRTPKFNLLNVSDVWHDKQYTSKKIDWVTVLEGVLAIYFLGGIVYGIYTGILALLPFHLLAFVAFLLIFTYSVKHARVVQS